MAKVLGEAGRYVSDQAVKQRRKMISVGFLSMSVISMIGGFLICLSFRNGNLWLLLSVPLMFAILVFLIWKWTSRKLDALEKKRMDMRKGAAGEMAVAVTLADLPDEFCVINDLTTPFGNLDHVVVGPTGVFVIDAKNWRGVVSADGKGELLLNGKPTEKQLVKPFVARIMNIKEKVRTLAPALDPYFQAVFAFTAARVDANWGTTGNVHCVREDQLFDYIAGKDFGKKWKSDEVQRIAQAFLGLAHMDIDFEANPARKEFQKKPVRE